MPQNESLDNEAVKQVWSAEITDGNTAGLQEGVARFTPGPDEILVGIISIRRISMAAVCSVHRNVVN